MWQGIRLIGDHQHNQFLGDMFEGFLDQGVKQSEGQYFTPGPICRFLLMSLPLESLVKAQPTPPKAIDYACGAGHFLTELALQLKPLVERHHPLKDIADYHAAIYGVEKEYRLSKIAKVSAFMYGQPAINICYGDALVPRHDAFPEIQNGTFDLLVANPPFSVRGFLETLPESERSAYRLTETIDKLDTANSIETFFLERAKQLLKPGGLAAIILPSSILSNGGTTYVRAREILLHSFDLVAIAEFGSGTFGKTGTNTVTLFLRRKATAPDTAEHFRERVDEWFKGVENNKRRQVIYKDAHLIERYAAHRGIAAEDFKTLLCGTPNAALLAHETFSAYRRAFDASTEIKNLKNQRKFRELKAPDQNAELGKRFLAFAHAIERDKLLHFILADQQPNRVLILKGPTDNKDQKKFLGYEWSAAKGGEGIQLIKDAQGHHLTPLYDETDRDNAGKLNHAIARNFANELKAIPDGLERYLSLVPVPELLDFSRASFEKQIALSVKTSVTVQSKWPFAKLGEVCSLNPSKAEIRSLAIGTPVTFVEMSSVSEKGTIAVRETRSIDDLRTGSFTYFADNDIIMAKITPCMENGKCALATGLSNGIGLGSSEFHVIRADGSKVLPSYVFAFVNREEIRVVAAQNMTGSSGHRRVPESFYADLPLPLPPLAAQEKIVAECAAIDAEAEPAQVKIEKAQRAMENAVNAVYASNAPRAAIVSLSLSVQYGLNEAMNEGGVGYKIFRMNEIFGGRMVDGGAMKCADIPAEEFSKYRLKRGDVLFNRTNSIEHVGKTGLFDLEGLLLCLLPRPRGARPAKGAPAFPHRDDELRRVPSRSERQSRQVHQPGQHQCDDYEKSARPRAAAARTAAPRHQDRSLGSRDRDRPSPPRRRSRPERGHLEKSSVIVPAQKSPQLSVAQTAARRLRGRCVFSAVWRDFLQADSAIRRSSPRPAGCRPSLRASACGIPWRSCRSAGAAIRGALRASAARPFRARRQSADAPASWRRAVPRRRRSGFARTGGSDPRRASGRVSRAG